jgi:pyruvate dehydrogenase E2 component (dihydrolipoamide acetyltransferase)
MGEFRMPSLGADMTEGTVLEWLVHPGDVVHRGDIMAVVDTAKSAIDIEVFEDGRVAELLVAPGTTVAVGGPLAVLAPLSEGAATPTPPPAAPAQVGHPAPVASPIVRHLAHERGIDLGDVVGTGPGGAVTRKDIRSAELAEAPATPSQVTTSPRVAASPVARRRAAELGVDLADVHLAPPGRAISLADVEAAGARVAPRRAHSRRSVAAAEPALARQPVDRSAAMRAATGALMARSKKEIPHYYLQTTIDLDRALTWLEMHNAERTVSDRLLPAALLLKAAALAARGVPEMNGFFVDGAFRASENVHIGVAVSLRGGGLVAPAMHDADRLAVDEVMARLKDLVARARSGRLKGTEMSDPTLTVTNLGDQGVEVVHGVIYPPQVALVGVGRVLERPWAVDGMLTVRRVVVATLAADHRVSDGHVGARFLSILDGVLQKPEEL